MSLIESNSKVELAIERLIPLDSKNHTSTRKFIRKKYSEYIGKKRFIYILSKFYRRIKYISILPSEDFSQRGLRSPRSKYYKEIRSILNSCKAD